MSCHRFTKMCDICGLPIFDDVIPNVLTRLRTIVEGFNGNIVNVCFIGIKIHQLVEIVSHNHIKPPCTVPYTRWCDRDSP